MSKRADKVNKVTCIVRLSGWELLTMIAIAFGLIGFWPNTANAQKIIEIENEVILQGRHNNRSWWAPTVTMVSEDGKKPYRIFVTAVNLVGRDLGNQYILRSDDLGKSWSNAMLPHNRHKIPLNIFLRRQTLADYNVYESPYFGLHYHKKAGRLMAVGRTHFTWDEYRCYSEPFKRTKDGRFFDGLCEGQLEGGIVYSVRDVEKEVFKPWGKVYLPVDVSVQIFPFGQFHEDDDGTLLLPGIDTCRQALPLSRTQERYLPAGCEIVPVAAGKSPRQNGTSWPNLRHNSKLRLQ